MLAFITFVKSPLFKYILILAAILGVVFGIYRAGANSVQKKWDKEVAERKVEVQIQRVIQDKITTLTNTVYVDRVKVVKEKGEKIYVEVPKYITTEDDAACRINAGFARLWNSAIQNELPGPPDETDRADAGVSLTEVEQNHITNTNICLQYKERAIAWEKWAHEQKESAK